MEYNIPNRAMKDILAFARKHNIQKVMLFGSRARGTHMERSDIDLAVSGGDFDSFDWDIRENAHSLLIFDVVNLDSGISEEFKKEIERDGVLLYEKT